MKLKSIIQRSADANEGGGSPEDQKILAHIKENTNAAITKALKDFEGNSDMTKSLKTLQDSLKDVVSRKDYEALKGELEKVALELKAAKEQSTAFGKKLSLVTELAALKSQLRSIAKGERGMEEVAIKSAIFHKTLLQRSGVDSTQQAFDLQDVGQLAHRKLSLYDLFPKITIGESNNNGTIRYYDWDEASITRAAAAVAEGAAYPESVAKFKKYSLVIEKVGDTLPVTEEFFEDEEMFAAELDQFLNTNVLLEIDRQLYAGDGASNTIVGLKSSTSAYSLPATGTVNDASIYDLIIKLSEAITKTGGAKYMPDFVVLNIADINKMRLKKDKNNNYVLPPFVSRDGNQVSTVAVVESNIVTANELVLGERRFGRIYEKGGIVLSRGYKGDQFVEDEMTLKARKRMAFLIRNADKGGFLKVTDINAALAAIDTSANP